MFTSEKQISKILDQLDDVVNSYARGDLTFSEFLSQYGYPLGEYSLDGHESDSEEKALLANFANRISAHQSICDTLSPLCSSEDAQNPLYKKAGRVGPEEMHGRLLEVVRKLGCFAT